MRKINFVISANTFTDLRRYSNLLNVSIPNVVRFILFEEIYQFEKCPKGQMDRIKGCAFRKSELKYSSSIHTSGKEKDLNYEVEPKKYSIQVSDYIYDGLYRIKESFAGRSTNEIVNDLIHIYIKMLGSCELYKNRDYKVTKEGKKMKRYALPSSDSSSRYLLFLSNRAHMSPNQLIAIMIGDYMLKYFTVSELDQMNNVN